MNEFSKEICDLYVFKLLEFYLFYIVRDLGNVINISTFFRMSGVILNQIAGGHPTLKGGVCFGPPARFPGYSEWRIKKASIFAEFYVSVRKRPLADASGDKLRPNTAISGRSVFQKQASSGITASVSMYNTV